MQVRTATFSFNLIRHTVHFLYLSSLLLSMVIRVLFVLNNVGILFIFSNCYRVVFCHVVFRREGNLSLNYKDDISFSQNEIWKFGNVLAFNCTVSVCRELPAPTSSKLTVGLTIGLTLGAILVLIGIAAVYYIRRRRGNLDTMYR